MKTVKDFLQLYQDGKTVEEVMELVLERIGDDPNKAFITLDHEKVKERARYLDKKKEEGKKLGKLFGVPITIKDNIMTQGLKTTAGSRALENYIPSYSASLVKRFEEEDGIIIGKTNLDEFATGGSSETSYFGISLNPVDPSKVPGGSSSGAAVAQKAGYAPINIGTDTGGSVRQPGSYCSVLGYKPSYGTISSWGVIPMASSLDHVGIFADNIEDIVETINIIGGQDEKDPASIRKESLDYKLYADDIQGLRVAYVDIDHRSDIDEKVKEDYQRSLEILKSLGADLKKIKLNYEDYLTPVYKIIMATEFSGNMARYDGIRFGYSSDSFDSVEQMYFKNRSEAFGDEVKKRIILGMYFSDSNNYQETYDKAIKVRELIREEVEKIFTKVDLLVSPSATDVPSGFGEKRDPDVDFKSGDYHVLLNLSGRPGISIPMNQGLGGSVQFACDRYEDEKLLNYANVFCKELR